MFYLGANRKRREEKKEERKKEIVDLFNKSYADYSVCLLYTSDAADDPRVV